MKVAKFNTSLPSQVYAALMERVGERGNRSGTIARDLGRLYDLYRQALREVPLTTAEACLICDVMNGTMPEPYSTACLWAEVEDGIRLNKMDEKWGVDGPALVERLRALTPLQALALIDAAERFWAGDLTEDARLAVRRFFHVTD